MKGLRIGGRLQTQLTHIIYVFLFQGHPPWSFVEIGGADWGADIRGSWKAGATSRNSKNKNCSWEGNREAKPKWFHRLTPARPREVFRRTTFTHPMSQLCRSSAFGLVSWMTKSRDILHSSKIGHSTGPERSTLSTLSWEDKDFDCTAKVSGSVETNETCFSGSKRWVHATVDATLEPPKVWGSGPEPIPIGFGSGPVEL